MGAARKLVVQGSKGGESTQKQPTIAANSTASIATARIVYLWSWGPIVGPVDGLRSVKLDGTPLVAEDGTVNFPGVKWQFRNGELNQQRLEGIAESSNEVDVNQQLLSTTPYLRTVNNPVLDALRIRLSWPQLQSQDQSGNINGVRIDYAIDLATDGGPFVQMLADFVDRKNVTKYERSHRINLPAGSRWTMRVRRITPEANSSLIQDSMFIEAVAEVVDSDQEFPLTAVGCVEYDAQQFGGDIAKIAVLMRGRIVRVPTNYDPETRTYATSGAGTSNGIWDGTFKEAYTNNPAWVCYDISLNPYYGLGHRIDATMVDRWNLYRIAQYCDQMVPNGMGGTHPPMTCNIYLQKQADAYAVLQDLSAIFHGMSTWDGSQITFNADMPGDPVYTYNPSQILNNGEIQYSGTRARDRHNLAMVTWDNPDQSFTTDKEPVFDDVAMAESGSVNELSVDAYGCTSLGQAQRAGQYALITEQTQTRPATFRVGLDGGIPKTGQIIAVADPMLAGRANGGRISAVAGRVITVDRDIDLSTGAKLRVNLPSGKTEARVITSLTGRRVTVAASFSEVPEAECGWILEYEDLKTMQFLVRNITRPEWHQYQLECIQHEPSKFDAIDFGAVVDIRPISGIPVGVQAAPGAVFVTQHVVIEQGIAVTNMTISWDAAPGAVAYDVEWRWGSREWVKVPRTGEQSVDVPGIYSGQYMARVRAVSALNVSSLPATSLLTNLQGKTSLPPAVTSLTATSLIFGIALKWTFPPGAEDTQRTEIWYGQANDLAKATKLSDLAYPQSEHVMQGLLAGVTFFFWARLVDRTGNVGPWYPTGAGVMGQTSSDAGAILEMIAGQITETELGQKLVEKIELIDGNGPGSVNDRLAAAKAALADQISDVGDALGTVRAELQQQIDSIADLADSMPYKPGETYSAGQGVLGADGIIYQATQNVPVNTPPPNSTYWLNVGQAVATAVGLASRVQTVETKVTSIEGVNTAQSQQITGLQSSLDGKASASSVQSLGNRVTDAEGKLSSQGSAITGINTELAGKASSATVQALGNTVTQQGQDIKAQGQAITSVTASLGNSGGQNLFFNPAFTNESAVPGVAEGWQIDVGTGGTHIPSLVPSWLVSTEKAQRIDVSDLNQAAGYRSIRIVSATYRPKVTAGNSVVASCYVRATAGLVFAIFIQGVNAAGTDAVTVSGPRVVATGGTQRIVYDFPNLPAGTASVQVYFRLYGSDTVNAGFAEYTRAQLEIGTTVSGWKDNNGVLGAEQSATSSAVAALSSSVSQQGATIIAQASSVQALQASSRDDNGDGELADAVNGYNSAAGIVQEATVRATQNEATARTVTQLTASVGANTGQITDLREVVTSNLASTATAITQLTTKVGDNSAAIQSEATARSSADGALSTKLDQVQATANGASAAVQTVSSAQAATDGKLTAMYTVKLQVNSNGQYVMAAIGAGIENVGGVLQSQILMSADRFALVNTLAGGAISTPFVAQNGQLFLGPTFIMDGTITNAKIGSFISSTDYVAGQRGWILRKDGTLEINGSGAGGGRLVVTNRSVRVYDANNVKRVQLGDLTE